MATKALIEILQTQLSLLEEMCALLDRETTELMNVNLDGMAEINRQKDELASRIEGQTAPFRAALSAAAVELGLPPEATLGSVAAVIGNRKSEIPRLHRELNEVAHRMKELAGLNRDIAERFAMTVKMSLDFLTRIINQSNVYGASGDYQLRQTGPVMVNREA